MSASAEAVTAERRRVVPGATRRRHPALLLAALGVLAALISFAGSGVPSFWSDEVATVRAASLPLPQLFWFLRHKDAVHGLYYVVMHGWIHLFGSSELALRAPSALAVGITAACIGLLGSKLRNLETGLAAGLVFAVLPRTTAIGIEARSYAMTAALATILTLLFVVARAGSAWWFAAYCAVAITASFLFVYLLLLIPAHLVIALLLRMDRRRWGFFGGAIVVALVAVAPFVHDVAGQKGQIAWLGSQPVLNAWTVIVEPWFESSLAAAIVGWGIIVVCLIRRRHLTPDRTALIVGAALIAVPVALLLLANIPFSPLYTSRYLSFTAPGMALLIGALLAAIPARRIGVGLLILLLAVSAPTIVAQRGPYAKNGGSDLRQLAQTVHEHAKPGDAIVFGHARYAALDPRQALYAYPTAFAGLDDVALKRSFPATGSFADSTVPVARLGPRLAGHGVVWLVEPVLTRSCTALPDARALERDGFASSVAYPVHRTTVCRFVSNEPNRP